METKLRIKGNWNETKAKLQKKYPKLTDEDLMFTKGNEDDLVSCITERLGKTEEEVMDIIDELQSEKSKPSAQQKGRAQIIDEQSEKSKPSAQQKGRAQIIDKQSEKSKPSAQQKGRAQIIDEQSEKSKPTGQQKGSSPKEFSKKRK
ncbi:MAG: hypothetical protein A3F72_04185 [Bacteroidetes bacterium RIFCSPLOWO2_12_FULL_35_15]|nr:MAG: hypothetical protein A3F72_04185 [Bacteroidetes bacterium RIFCSPLOWO2_12_FULL_35_15]